MCIVTTLHVYRNDLYRNDFVSKRPDAEESLGFFSPRPGNLKRLATPKSDQSRPAN